MNGTRPRILSRMAAAGMLDGLREGWPLRWARRAALTTFGRRERSIGAIRCGASPGKPARAGGGAPGPSGHAIKPP
jgi:hypothetical protein